MVLSESTLDPQPSSDHSRNTNGAPILIPFVGPEPRAQELSLLLTHSGYQLVPANDVKAILEQCRDSGQWSALLLECTYEDEIWRETCRSFRDLPNPPFLVTITKFEPDQWSEMIEEGILESLTDPLRSETLIRLLDTAHKRWHRDSEQHQFRQQIHRDDPAAEGSFYAVPE